MTPSAIFLRREIAAFIAALTLLAWALYPSEYARGLMQREEGDRSRSIALFSAYLRRHPRHKGAALALADAYEAAGRPEAALGPLLDLYRRRRGDLETGRKVLDLYDRAGMPAKAEGFLWEFVADLRALPVPPRREIEELLYQAFQLAAARQDDSATIKALTALAEIAVDSSSYRGEMLRLLMARRKLDVAADVLYGAYRRDPSNTGLLRTLARLYVVKGDYAKARAELDLAAKLRPGDVGVLADRAALFTRQARPDLAEEEYRRLMTLQPQERSWPRELGSSLIKRGKIRAGVRVYESLLAREPGDRESWLNIVYAYADRGEHGEAARRLQKYLRLYPNDDEASGLLVYELESAGEIDKAVAALRDRVRLRPRDAVRRVELAGRLMDDEQFAQAEEQYRAAVDLEPAVADHWLALVYSQEMQKKRAETAATLEGYLKRFPGDGKAVEMLADDYVRLERRDKAIALLRSYLKPLVPAAGARSPR